MLLAAYGKEREDDSFEAIGIVASRDRGETWRHLASLRAPHEMTEPGIARLRDGTLVVITRSEGALSWSRASGQTCTTPRNLPARIFDPWLLTLRYGTLLCVLESYTKSHGGLRALLSKDCGNS